MTVSTLRSPGVTVYREVRADRLPLCVTVSGTKIFGGLAVFIGGSFMALALVAGAAMVRDASGRELLPAAVVFIGTWAFCLPILLWGLNQFVTYRSTTIDATSVRWQWRHLFGSGEEVASLREFEGVSHSTRHDSEDGMLYQLELKHLTDPRKSVLLYVANREYDISAKWHIYCDALGLPPVKGLSRCPEDTGHANHRARG